MSITSRTSFGRSLPRCSRTSRIGVPSLRTIIEVKFLRSSCQPAYAALIEEIAADASLYLSKPSLYDPMLRPTPNSTPSGNQGH
jgi:REase_DpnII-MboI